MLQACSYRFHGHVFKWQKNWPKLNERWGFADMVHSGFLLDFV